MNAHLPPDAASTTQERIEALEAENAELWSRIASKEQNSEEIDELLAVLKDLTNAYLGLRSAASEAVMNVQTDQQRELAKSMNKYTAAIAFAARDVAFLAERGKP